MQIIKNGSFASGKIGTFVKNLLDKITGRPEPITPTSGYLGSGRRYAGRKGGK